MSGKRAILLGAYGQTNLGDDLLLYNYINLLIDKGYKDIYVNTSEKQNIPDELSSKYPQITLFDTYSATFLFILKLIKSTDIIVYGGGTVYKELYASTGRSKYSLLYRITIFNFIARILKKKTYNLHIGIGVIKTPLGRLLTRLSLLSCEFTVFRDVTSFDYAKKLKLPIRRISFSTDGLYLQKIWLKTWKKYKFKENVDLNRNVIGINLLSDIPDWINRDNYISEMLNFLKYLLDQGNFIVFIPFQTGFNSNNDLTFMKLNILPHLIKYENYTVADTVSMSTIVSCLKQLNLFIGMRFHSLLLSTAVGIPYIAVAYDTKCLRFIEESEYPYALKLEELKSEKLIKLYRKSVSDINIEKLLKNITTENYKKAYSWIENTNI